LRLAHLMSSTRTTFRHGLAEDFLTVDRFRLGLDLPMVRVLPQVPTGIFARAKGFLSLAYHTVTRGAFKEHRIENSSLAILSKQDDRLRIIQKQTLGRHVKGEGTDHTIGASQRSQTRYSEKEFGKSDQDQAVIIDSIQSADELGLLTVEEKRILEMIKFSDKDRLIRALNLFSYRKDRLKHPEFRVLFDLLCQNIIGLESSANERVEIGKVVASFLGKTIDHFKKTKDLETALFMIQMGVELEGFFCSHDPRLRENFPAFSWEIREVILPEYAALSKKEAQVNVGKESVVDGIYLALTTLCYTYVNVDIAQLEDEERNQALEDISRFAFYLGRQPNEFSERTLHKEGRALVYKWATLLKGSCTGKVLNFLRQDARIALGEEPREWEGRFPIFQTRERDFRVNLTEKTVNGHSAVFLLEKGEEHLRKIFRKEELGNVIYRGNNLYEYTDLQVSIRWNPRDHAFDVLKMIEGERAKLYRKDEINIKWGFSPFEFKDTDHIFVSGLHIYVYRDEELTAKFTRSFDGSNTINIREHFIQGQWHSAVDLSKQKHRLTLLNWFTDLNDIEAFSRPQMVDGQRLPQDRLTFLRLKESGLEFKIVETEGKLQAVSMSDGTAGYVLKERQDDPRLYAYPHALIMQNETGAEKVVLKSLPFATVFAKFNVNNLGRAKTSPFIDQ
ncbi:MAG: hypothetical protein HRU43_06965, partial [Simkaniaceae bacterium]|nr:hypothetical protein [Simkaniaceae bacterium]